MKPPTSSQLQLNAEEPPRWIVVGRLLDARKRRILKNAHLLYNRQQILHVGENPPPANLLDGRHAPDQTLSDYTAIPGLIEGHSHIFLEGAEMDADKRKAYQQQDPETLYQLAETRLRTLACLGIIAMRDGGDKDGVGLRLSELTNTGTPPPFLSQVFSPGAGINRKGRYGSFFSKPVEDHNSPADCVRDRVDAGADHIKIVPTGIINFTKGEVVAKPQFSTEDIREFKQAALDHHKHLMAHASGRTGVGYAIEGGVDTVEHGFFISDDQLTRMRDLSISWVPTFTPVQKQVDHAKFMGWSDEIVGNLKRILDNHANSLTKAVEMGVNVLVGSDAGSYAVGHGSGLFDEMELLEKAGMPTLDILCQATHGNNQALTGGQSFASLEAGFAPRFILTRNNPLETVANLKRERLVVFDGAVADSSTASLAGM